MARISRSLLRAGGTPAGGAGLQVLLELLPLAARQFFEGVKRKVVGELFVRLHTIVNLQIAPATSAGRCECES